RTEASYAQRNPKGQGRGAHRALGSDGRSGLPRSRERILSGRGETGGNGAGPAGASGILEYVAGIVADEVRSGLADLLAEIVSQQSPPKPLDRRGLAEWLGCSLPTVDRLRREGCPELMVGDSPRFEPDAVLAWLREREVSR